MKKVMVTVLRHNTSAQEFFLNKLKYVLHCFHVVDWLIDPLFSSRCFPMDSPHMS